MVGGNSSKRSCALLEPDLYAAVIIPPIRRQMPSSRDFRPEILVENVADAGEYSHTAVTKIHFSRQVPDRVSGTKNW